MVLAKGFAKTGPIVLAKALEGEEAEGGASRAGTVVAAGPAGIAAGSAKHSLALRNEHACDILCHIALHSQHSCSLKPFASPDCRPQSPLLQLWAVWRNTPSRSSQLWAQSQSHMRSTGNGTRQIPHCQAAYRLSWVLIVAQQAHALMGAASTRRCHGQINRKERDACGCAGVPSTKRGPCNRCCLLYAQLQWRARRIRTRQGDLLRCRAQYWTPERSPSESASKSQLRQQPMRDQVLITRPGQPRQQRRVRDGSAGEVEISPSPGLASISHVLSGSGLTPQLGGRSAVQSIAPSSSPHTGPCRVLKWQQ